MNNSADFSDKPADASMGYERSDTRGRFIFVGLGVGILVILLTVVFLNEVFVMTTEAVTTELNANSVNPILLEVQSRGDHNISTYEWVDSTTGVVRIPVERAMELMVEEARTNHAAAGN